MFGFVIIRLMFIAGAVVMGADTYVQDPGMAIIGIVLMSVRLARYGLEAEDRTGLAFDLYVAGVITVGIGCAALLPPIWISGLGMTLPGDVKLFQRKTYTRRHRLSSSRR